MEYRTLIETAVHVTMCASAAHLLHIEFVQKPDAMLAHTHTNATAHHFDADSLFRVFDFSHSFG